MSFLEIVAQKVPHLSRLTLSAWPSSIKRISLLAHAAVDLRAERTMEERWGMARG
jgi:hypothetical protein